MSARGGGDIRQYINCESKSLPAFACIIQKHARIATSHVRNSSNTGRRTSSDSKNVTEKYITLLLLILQKKEK